MGRIAAATLAVALIVVASGIASAGPALAPSSPTLTCDVTTIPAKSGSVETTCTVKNFPSDTVVGFLGWGNAAATTNDDGRAGARILIPCCFPYPGEIKVTATGADGTTATTTVTVVAAAVDSVPAQPTFTG